MSKNTPQRWRIRSLAVMSTLAVLAGGAAASPGFAAPGDDDCATLTAAEEHAAELCLPESELLTMNDAGATLAVDEVSSSWNLHQVANVPKQGPFDDQNMLNSDIAFEGDYAFAGNYGGFTIYNIRNPKKPTVVSQVLCPGAQNDISVYRDLVILSTDSSRNNNSCSSTGQSQNIKESWEGIKIFDVSDKRNPRYVSAVETNCGSHTHTLVPSKDRRSVYVYVSSYFPSTRAPDCQPPHDLVSIVKIPLKTPEQAALVATPNLFPDGGNPGGNGSSTTSGCHDITAYPEKNLAAGACMGDGILMDITNPEAPRVINQVRDTTNFAFWHSATFSQDGRKVIFTDELGGGSGPTCNETVGPNRGADAIYDITGRGDSRTMVFASYFKIPRANTNTENCVAHNGSIVPTLFTDVMVQAWYQGGISVIDFTDSKNPKEIAYWERGPLSDTQLILGGSWSAYYYNGYIFSNDIQKGLDVLDLRDPRTFFAKLNRQDRLNVQSQPEYWF